MKIQVVRMPKKRTKTKKIKVLEVLFADRIVDVIVRKGFQSPEFQMMIQVFGKKKLTEICILGMQRTEALETIEARIDEDGFWKPVV